MSRLVIVLLLGGLGMSCAGCASSAGEGSASGPEAAAAKTYDQIVREIGRPPNRTLNAPDGSRQATWETNVRNGVRHLTITFDSSGRMTGHSTSVKPRRVRRR